MASIIEYKGYYAIIEYSTEDRTLFGKVQDITDSIIFEIDNPKEADKIFSEVIEDYLEMCMEIGKDPCKSFKGQFNVRISPDLHRQAVQKSRLEGITLNQFVEKAIQKYVTGYNNVQSINIYVQKEDKSNISEKLYNERVWKKGAPLQLDRYRHKIHAVN